MPELAYYQEVLMNFIPQTSWPQKTSRRPKSKILTSPGPRALQDPLGEHYTVWSFSTPGFYKEDSDSQHGSPTAQYWMENTLHSNYGSQKKWL